MYEDDRIIVTRERYENDVFNAYIDLRVAVKDTSTHVLVTSAEQAEGDPREAILLKGRMDCVTTFLSSNLASFDIQDTESDSYRLFNQMTDLTHHLCTLDTTVTHLDDGSVCLSFTGDPLKMKYEVYEEGLLLAALSLTDLSGATGRTEIFYLNQPDAHISELNTAYSAVNPPSYFHLYGAQTYYHDEYAYLSLRFNADNVATNNLMLRLTSIDGAEGNFSETPVYLRETDYMYYQPLEARYQQAVLRIEDLPEQVNYMTVQAYAEGSNESLFEINLRRSSLTVTPTPDAPPTAASSPTPVPTPAPAPVPTEPPYNLARYIRRYPSVYKDANAARYLAYSTQLRVYDDACYLHLYFRLAKNVPEGSLMRITAIGNQTGNFGEAEILSAKGVVDGPDDLLMAQIYAPYMPEDPVSVVISCIDPETDEAIFFVSLRRSDSVHVEYNNAESYTHTPRPTTKATPAPEPGECLYTAALTIDEKPLKYAHYHARLSVYMERAELAVRFRYHDPLPEGTVLRLAGINNGHRAYGEALIIPDPDSPSNRLYANIVFTDLPDRATHYTLAAFAPGEDEPIFEVVLTSESSGGSWSGDIWYAPGGDAYKPIATPNFPLKDAIEDGMHIGPH